MIYDFLLNKIAYLIGKKIFLFFFYKKRNLKLLKKFNFLIKKIIVFFNINIKQCKGYQYYFF